MVSAWNNQARSGKCGHPKDYAETAILTMATLQEIYHLPLRRTEGFLRSIFELLNLDLAVPDYSTLSRRRVALEIELPCRRRAEPVHLVVDSTRMKVFGEGEWKVRKHGYSYRSTWRRLHLIRFPPLFHFCEVFGSATSANRVRLTAVFTGRALGC